VEALLFQGAANPRGRGPEVEQYEGLLRSWFGFTEARLFRESCFVHENALETRISPELRHLISGAVEARLPGDSGGAAGSPGRAHP